MVLDEGVEMINLLREICRGTGRSECWVVSSLLKQGENRHLMVRGEGCANINWSVMEMRRKNRKRHCGIMETKNEKVKKENQLKGGNVLRRAWRMLMEFYYSALTCNLQKHSPQPGNMRFHRCSMTLVPLPLMLYAETSLQTLVFSHSLSSTPIP